LSTYSCPLTILIPTLDEARWIGPCLDALTASLGALDLDAQLIVCDGGSRDATRAIAARYPVTILTSSPGRPAQLNAALPLATGRLVAILHADALITPATLRALLAAAHTHDAGWFQLQDILHDGPERGLTTHGLALIAWGINLRTRLFHTATGDQLIWATRALLIRVGGVPDLPVMECNALVRRLRAAAPTATLAPLVRISGRRWQRQGLLRTTLQMYALRAAYMARVPPTLLVRSWRSSESP
jgi:glycosyltransferase involved in cell wall biosynthesis